MNIANTVNTILGVCLLLTFGIAAWPLMVGLAISAGGLYRFHNAGWYSPVVFCATMVLAAGLSLLTGWRPG